MGKKKRKRRPKTKHEGPEQLDLSPQERQVLKTVSEAVTGKGEQSESTKDEGSILRFGEDFLATLKKSAEARGQEDHD